MQLRGPGPASSRRGINQIWSGQDPGETMGSSEDKERLETLGPFPPSPLVLDSQAPEAPLRSAWLPPWGKGPWAALQFSQGHLSWPSPLFPPQRHATVCCLSFFSVQGLVQALKEYQGISQAFVPSPIPHCGWSGVLNAQVVHCSCLLRVQTSAPCLGSTGQRGAAKTGQGPVTAGSLQAVLEAGSPSDGRDRQ